MVKSGTPNLGFDWEPTPTTTLIAMVPCQASQKAGLLGRAPLAMLLERDFHFVFL